jgi:hypothetical protein
VLAAAPKEEFVYRPMAVVEPFARGRAQRHRLDAIARQLEVEPIQMSLASVAVPARHALTDDGPADPYGALVVAIGARTEPAFTRALTWTPERDADVFGLY